MTSIIDLILRAKTDGYQQAAADMNAVAGAEEKLIATKTTDTKVTLNLERQTLALQKSLDSVYRGELALEVVEKKITAAREAGLITAKRETELLGLASAKYRETGESAKFMSEGLRVGKEMAMGLISGFAGGAAFAGLAELPTKILDVVHEAAGLTHVAEAIGITTTQLQELQITGQQFHVSTDTMDSALERFSKNLGTAAQGSSDFGKILRANHVTLSGDVSKDLLSVANLIQHTGNAEERNRLVTDAFGKSAEEMGNFFNEGADGILRAGTAAETTGGILGGEALKNALALDQKFIDIKVSADALFKDLAITTAPLWMNDLRSLIDNLRMVQYGIDQLKAGNIGLGAAAIVGQQPAGNAPYSAYESNLEFRMRAGAADMTPNFPNQGAVNDFYSDIPGIQKPLKVNVGGPNTKMPPPAADAGAVKQASEIKKVTDALNLQTKNLTETNREQAINNELAKAHVALASKDGQAIATLAGKYYDQKQAIDAANQAASFFAQTTETAFEGIITGSSSVQDALSGIVKALAQAVIQAELLGSGPLAGILGTSPTTSGGAGGILGNLFSALIPHANGGVYSSPSLSAFSNQVVDKPTYFQFAKGGVFGEAGPEAIMPLKMGANGQLGVQAANSNGGGTTITNHYHIDATGAEIGVEQKIVDALKAYDQNQPARVLKIMGDKRAR